MAMAAAAMMMPLIFVDATFLCSNLLKIVDGAWAPLALGAAIVLGNLWMFYREQRVRLLEKVPEGYRRRT